MSDSEYKYGSELKNVVFVEDDKRHADLRIRLRHDGITQTQFFQGIITGYLNKDERIIEYMTDLKYEIAKQGKSKIKKTRALIDDGSRILEEFSFTSAERKELFDVIAEEAE